MIDIICLHSSGGSLLKRIDELQYGRQNAESTGSIGVLHTAKITLDGIHS
ncbi:MAG: hypothetical protein WDO68_31125 [Gammaproteobacteria bacterium]